MAENFPEQRQALEEARTALKADDGSETRADLIIALNNLATPLYGEDAREALPLFAEAVQLASSDETLSNLLETALENLVEGALRAGYLPQGLEALTKLNGIWRSRTGNDPQLQGKFLRSLERESALASQLGETDTAERSLDEALMHRRAEAGTAGLGGDIKARLSLADTLLRRAELQLQAERAAETEELLREVRALEDFREGAPPHPEAMQRLFVLLPTEARHAELTGALDLAAEKLKQALTLLPPPSTPLPAAAELRRLGLMSQLAAMEAKAGRPDQGLAVAAAAMGLLEKTDGLAEGQKANMRAALLSRKGAAERLTGALDAAETTLKEALTLLESSQEHLPADDLVEGLETVLAELGETLKAKGQDGEGEALIKRAKTLAEPAA